MTTLLYFAFGDDTLSDSAYIANNFLGFKAVEIDVDKDTGLLIGLLTNGTEIILMKSVPYGQALFAVREITDALARGENLMLDAGSMARFEYLVPDYDEEEEK